MIERLTDATELLYHYTKSSVALEHILANRSLRLSSYTNTNDPKETKAWQFTLGTNQNRDLKPSRANELSLWLSNEFKQRTRLACFCLDTLPLTGDHLEDIFNRGFCKPRMWAQYAERHTGVCLVFNRKRLAQIIQDQLGPEPLVISGPVQYLNRSVVPNLYEDNEYTINLDVLEADGPELYADRHLRTHYQRLFFEKMTDWRDEREWRWVVFAQSEAHLYIKFQDALVGIMFGEETAEKNVREIIALTECWGLAYMGLKWKNHSPWYDYGNLRYIPGIKNSPWGQSLEW